MPGAGCEVFGIRNFVDRVDEGRVGTGPEDGRGTWETGELQSITIV